LPGLRLASNPFLFAGKKEKKKKRGRDWPRRRKIPLVERKRDSF